MCGAPRSTSVPAESVCDGSQDGPQPGDSLDPCVMRDTVDPQGGADGAHAIVAARSACASEWLQVSRKTPRFSRNEGKVLLVIIKNVGILGA